MPVTIACPKCQTKYKLPDSSLGKAVKCQKCSTAFKTQAPGAPAQARPSAKQKVAQQRSPAEDAAAQQRAQEMAKLGIDGPLQKQGDIFGNALPQGAGQLGNFAGEDPGFGDVKVGRGQSEAVESVATDDGMESILDNPFVAPGSSGGVHARLKSSGGGAGAYGAAKVGMWIVLVSTGVLIGVGAFLGILTAVGRFAPFILTWLAENVGEIFGTIIGILFLVCVILSLVATLAIFVGQICCIFSPNKDEKLFAGLAVGAIALALMTLMGIFFMGMLGGMMGRDADGAKVAMGLFALLGIFAVYGLILANLFLFINYFKRVGRNLKSKKVVKASNLATVTCIAAIGVGIISGIAIGILLAVFKDKPDLASMLADITFGINIFLSFATAGNILTMVKTTLEVLKSKSL